MEFSHVANPVRVSAKRIANIDHRMDGTGLIDIMFEDESQTILTDEMVARYVPVLGDYFVIQEDGYGYVNPKDVFERKYNQIEQQNGMDFGNAIRALKFGKRVARAGWNGKGQFVYMVPPASYPVQTGAAKAHFGEGSLVPYNAYLALKTADERVSTWVPSVTDCLSDDWQIV